MMIFFYRMYLNLNDIVEIQIDHTSRCNLGCPQCARNKKPWSLNPLNKTVDLTLEDYKILLEPFKEESISLFHCGNFGDAVASPTFDETLRYSLSKNPKKIIISSNGSLRPRSWWKELAELGKNKIQVTFAIDGLKDTNPIYRIGSSFDKIMENAQAFIDAGGRARWDFIEFEHNYHQIEEAEALAKKMGFEKFNVKYTARFASTNVKSEPTKTGYLLKDRDSNVNQKNLREIKSEHGSFDDYVLKTKISCKYQTARKVFVDMHMKLWPCCWFGAPLYFGPENKQNKNFVHLESLYGKDFNDLRKFGWGLLEHDFFMNYLEGSWMQPDEKYKRVYTCGRTCGEKFEFSSGYGQNSHIRSLQ